MRVTAEGKRNTRDAVEMIMLPEIAKSMYLKTPTVEMTTRHGTPTAHGGERRVSA